MRLVLHAVQVIGLIQLMSTAIPSAPTNQTLARIKGLAAQPKALSLKDLEAARTEVHVLNHWHGAPHPCLARYLKVLDTEYISRLTTFFPMLLEASHSVASAPTTHRGIAILELRSLITQIGAPTQPPAPSFKVGDYVTYHGRIVHLASEIDVSAALLSGPDVPRLSTPDEIRAHLLAESAKLGFVVGVRVKVRSSHYRITCLHVWMPGDTISGVPMAQRIIGGGTDKPTVWVELDTHYAAQLSELTVAPEPTHYLYRVIVRGDVISRQIESSGHRADLDKRCVALNDRVVSPYRFFKVYPKQMPTRETV